MGYLKHRKFLLMSLALALNGKAWGFVKEAEILQSSSINYPLIKQAMENHAARDGEVRAQEGQFDTTIKGDNLWVSKGYYRRKYNDVKIVKPFGPLHTDFYAGYVRAWNGIWPPQYSTMSTNSGGTPYVGAKISVLRGMMLDERRGHLRSSSLAAAQAQMNLDLTRVQVKRDSIISYWSWFLAVRHYYVFKNLLKIAEDRAGILETRFKAGDISHLVVIENAQYLARRRAELADASNLLQQSTYDLSLFYRDEQGNPIVTVIPDESELKLLQDEEFYPKVETPIVLEAGATTSSTEPGTAINALEATKFREKTEKIYDDALAKRPDFLSLHKDLERTDIDLSLGRNQLLPLLDLSLDYTRNRGGEDPANAPHILTFKVMLDIPLEYNLGLGKMQEARARQRNFQSQVSFLRDTIKNEISKKIESIRLAKIKMENAHKEVLYAAELLKAEYFKNKLGNSNFFLINIREEAVATAQANELAARFELIKNHTEYQAETMSL